MAGGPGCASPSLHKAEVVSRKSQGWGRIATPWCCLKHCTTRSASILTVMLYVASCNARHLQHHAEAVFQTHQVKCKSLGGAERARAGPTVQRFAGFLHPCFLVFGGLELAPASSVSTRSKQKAQIQTFPLTAPSRFEAPGSVSNCH